MAKLGEQDYRAGARERLAESYLLLRNEQLGGSIYLAGRSVEGMLRAVIWKSDAGYAIGTKSLETGHNLRELLQLIGRLGALRHSAMRDRITVDVQHVARLWWTDMRFLPQAKVQSRWYDLGEIRGKRTFKLATAEYYDSCSAIIKRCEALWQK